MKYHILTEQGSEVTLTLPITPEATWLQFCSLPEVRTLGAIQDVTPEGMPVRFTDEEALMRQLANMGYKKSRKLNGQPLYEEIAEDTDDSDDAGDLNP